MYAGIFISPYCVLTIFFDFKSLIFDASISDVDMLMRWQSNIVCFRKKTFAVLVPNFENIFTVEKYLVFSWYMVKTMAK